MPRRSSKTARPQRHKHKPGHQKHNFRCVGCRLDVSLDAPGTAHRNHCPNCLVSLHVDRRIPGDRAAACRGRMEALSVTVRPDGEWLIIHQCQSCPELSTNRIAGDDNALALMRLALKPLRDARVAQQVLLGL